MEIGLIAKELRAVANIVTCENPQVIIQTPTNRFLSNSDFSMDVFLNNLERQLESANGKYISSSVANGNWIIEIDFDEQKDASHFMHFVLPKTPNFGKVKSFGAKVKLG